MTRRNKLFIATSLAAAAGVAQAGDHGVAIAAIVCGLSIGATAAVSAARGKGEVQMKRLPGVIAAMTLGALVFVGVAGATKPYMERPALGPVTFAAGKMCGFPVLIQPTAPDVLNVIIFSNDEFFSSGPEVATATNLDSGKSIKINISGTVSFVPHKDGSATLTFNGPTLSVPEGVISDGRLVLQFDADGNLTSWSLVGKQTDVCAELAGS